METYFDKPIGTQVTTLSNSVTQLTEGVNNTQDGLAIVANGNTHPQIASGQYVYVKNHESLADGLYKASTAISTNDPLSTSNLVADNSGGLNALKSDVDTLNSKLTDKNNEHIANPDVSFHATNPYTLSIDPYEYDVLYCYIAVNNDTERRAFVTIPIRMQRELLGTNTERNKVYYLLPSPNYPEVVWLDITISPSGVVFKTSASAIPAKLMSVYGVKHVE